MESLETPLLWCTFISLHLFRRYLDYKVIPQTRMATSPAAVSQLPLDAHSHIAFCPPDNYIPSLPNGCAFCTERTLPLTRPYTVGKSVTPWVRPCRSSLLLYFATPSTILIDLCKQVPCLHKAHAEPFRVDRRARAWMHGRKTVVI